MKRAIVRLVAGTGELRLRGAAAMTQVLTFIFPATLPPEDRALVVGADGQLRYSGVGATAFRQTFTQANLTAGSLTVTHNLNRDSVLVQVIDNLNDAILPDNLRFAANTVTVDLASFGAITGTWRVVVVG